MLQGASGDISVVEHLLSIHEALVLISSLEGGISHRERKRKRRRGGRCGFLECSMSLGIRVEQRFLGDWDKVRKLLGSNLQNFVVGWGSWHKA